MPSKKLQRKLAEDAGLSVVMTALAMIVAAPFYVYAIGDGTTTGALDLGGVSYSLRAIKDDVEVLRGRLDLVNSKLDSMSSRLETVYLSDADPVATSPGVAECLDTCRRSTATCFAAPTAARPTTAGLTGTGGVNSSACQSRVESCARLCRPTTDALACDTTCAIQLGACVKGAGTDGLLAAACKKSNETCLKSLCPRSGRTTAEAVLPPDTCRNQCARDFTVCRQANRLNSSALSECAQSKKACEETACAGASASASGTVPQAAAENIVCENDCTRSFLACRNAAGDNIQALEFCNSGYGTCRNQCLITSGGGFTQETASPTMAAPPTAAPATETVTPTSRGQ